MAIITDYTTLSSTVESYLDRSDLTSFVPNFIESAETIIYRTTKTRGIENAFNEVISSGAIDLTSLTGSKTWRNAKYLYVASSPVTPLEFVDPDILFQKYPDRSTSETKPHMVARVDDTLIFGPAAAAVTVKGIYYELLGNLSATNTTNWFITNAPEVLLYGSLIAAEPFIVGDERLPVWSSLYKASFDAVEEETRVSGRGGGRKAVKVL